MPEYRSKTSTHGRNMAGARALWRATGMQEGDFNKPIIAVANSFTQFVPGHVHLKDLGQMVEEESRAHDHDVIGVPHAAAPQPEGSQAHRRLPGRARSRELLRAVGLRGARGNRRDAFGQQIEKAPDFCFGVVVKESDAQDAARLETERLGQGQRVAVPSPAEDPALAEFRG